MIYLLLTLQVMEKQRLIEFAESLRAKLNYFDELENVRFECYLLRDCLNYVASLAFTYSRVLKSYNSLKYTQLVVFLPSTFFLVYA